MPVPDPFAPSAAVAAATPITTQAELAERVRANALLPTWGDAKDCGGTIVDLPGGKREARFDFSKPGVKANYRDMMLPYIQAEGERCMRSSAVEQTRREVLVDARGERHEVKPHEARQIAARKGVQTHARAPGFGQGEMRRWLECGHYTAHGDVCPWGCE